MGGAGSIKHMNDTIKANRELLKGRRKNFEFFDRERSVIKPRITSLRTIQYTAEYRRELSQQLRAARRDQKLHIIGAICLSTLVTLGLFLLVFSEAGRVIVHLISSI